MWLQFSKCVRGNWRIYVTFIYRSLKLNSTSLNEHTLRPFVELFPDGIAITNSRLQVSRMVNVLNVSFVLFFFIFVVVSIVDVEEITFIMSSWPKRTILLIINSSNHSTVQCRSCPFGCKCYTAGRTLVISIRIAYNAEYSWRVKRSEWNPMTSPPSPNLNRIVFAPQPHICHLKIFCLFIHHHRLCVFVWECMCKYNICLRLRLTLAPSASK